jgi:DNA ligase-1
VVRHEVLANTKEIMALHNTIVQAGYEGAMVKTMDSSYQFGRSYDVMKVKEFHDVDLPIIGLEEGTGRHEGRLGAVKINFNGVIVKVGSGFSDEEREQVWDDQYNFLGRMIEVRYQEVTPDGSLRFPTFVCFRTDRDI